MVEILDDLSNIVLHRSPDFTCTNSTRPSPNHLLLVLCCVVFVYYVVDETQLTTVRPINDSKGLGRSPALLLGGATIVQDDVVPGPWRGFR